MKRKEKLDQIEKFENELSTNDIYKMDRRTFVKVAGTAVGVLAFGTGLSSLAPRALASVQVPQTPLDPKTIPQYVDALPTFVGARVSGEQLLNISMENTTAQVLPASVYPVGVTGTKVWAYQIANSLGRVLGPANYPAFTIESTKGTATNVTYANNLVDTTIPGDQTGTLYKLITVDQTLDWADPLGTTKNNNCTVPPATGVCTQPYTGPVPAVTHLHGGEVPSASDGGPNSWFTPGDAQVGPAWGQGVTNNYFYPNGQEATTLWYHDHTLGATRLNVYAGLAGFYFLRDQYDTGVTGTGLNLPAGNQEIEIVIQDRMFDTNGQWLFPDSANPGPNGPPPNPTVHPNWIPEFFGTTIVVNGKTWPFLNVEPRRYRFRFLNGSNARFYELRLQVKSTGAPGPDLWQIGTDGGLLDNPVNIARLFFAPGERADIIVDFSKSKGQTFILANTAKAPYPSGTAPNPQTVGQIMQFSVNLPLSVKKDTSFNPTAQGATLRGGANQPPAIVRLADPVNGTLASGVTVDKTRLLTLKEIEGPGGPIEVLVNNTKFDGALSPNSGGINEMPQVGSTELWEIVNLTADAHPIHLHLVQFQLINRQNFNQTQYLNAYNAAFPVATFPDSLTGQSTFYPGGVFIPAYGPPMPYGSTPKLGGNPDVTPYLQNNVIPPDPNEAGWKDTIKMFPGQVTRIVVRWAPQDIPVGGISAGTNAYPFDPKTGPGYVWHCHIVDHEDNEMMRPYTVA
jgi:spore coat protein A